MGQNNTLLKTGHSYYDYAYNEIVGMICSEKSNDQDFKKAVFFMENAYFDGQLDGAYFEHSIQKMASLCQVVTIDQGALLDYPYADSTNILKNWALYRIFSDTLQIVNAPGDTIPISNGFSYDFDDIWGNKQWENTFVSKLIETGKGNCHSLPFLYKILAYETGAKAYLALAPNHIYIKGRSEKSGMYNTELTSASFPVDAWLMASGYIHLSAIRSGIYMDTLTQKQELCLILFDLLKGYERKYGLESGLPFLTQANEFILRTFPKYVNAMIMKSELLKIQYDHAPNVNEKKQYFAQLQENTKRLYTLGYRRMPEEMYEAWIKELQNNKDKYANPNFIGNLPKNH